MLRASTEFLASVPAHSTFICGVSGSAYPHSAAKGRSPMDADRQKGPGLRSEDIWAYHRVSTAPPTRPCSGFGHEGAY